MNTSILGSRLANAGGIVLFGLVYALTAKLGLTYSVVASNVTLIWPPTGISLVVILVFGYRLWPGIVIGDLIANWGTGIPLWAILGISLGNLMQTLICVWVLRQHFQFRPELDRVRDVLALLLLAAVGAAISALIGPASLALGGAITWDRYWYTWLIWWMGDSAGVAVVAPAFLAWVALRGQEWNRARLAEGVVLLVALFAVSAGVFGGFGLVGRGYYPAALAIFPVAIWAALRFGTSGAATVTLFVAIAAIWGTVQGRGPFADASPLDSTVRWWVFANMIAITSLLLAASQSELLRAAFALRRAHQDLEARVGERTRELASANQELESEMVERRRLEREIINVSEQEQMRIGQELHDGLGQHLAGISFLSEVLEQKLSARDIPEARDARKIETLVSDAVSQTRLLARGLYPVELESNGLMSALEQLAVNTRRLYGGRCIFRCDRPVLVHDNDAAINLYRIAQEATNNALRHSSAKNILIELGMGADALVLSVTDDGVGFDEKTIARKSGMGLRIMRYRAKLIGAKLAITNNARAGLSVQLVMSMPDPGGERTDAGITQA